MIDCLNSIFLKINTFMINSMEKKMEEMKKMKKMIHKIDKIQKKKMHNYLIRQLTEAVAQNNFAKVEELLKNGADVSIIGK